MMNPSVGDTLLMSSPMMLLTIDVLPLLSSPLHCFVSRSPALVSAPFRSHSIKTRISLSFNRALRRIDNILIVDVVAVYL